MKLEKLNILRSVFIGFNVHVRQLSYLEMHAFGRQIQNLKRLFDIIRAFLYISGYTLIINGFISMRFPVCKVSNRKFLTHTVSMITHFVIPITNILNKTFCRCQGCEQFEP